MKMMGSKPAMAKPMASSKVHGSLHPSKSAPSPAEHAAMSKVQMSKVGKSMGKGC